MNDMNALRGRSLFFDANIIIYIFYDCPNWAIGYDRLFAQLLRLGNKLVIDFNTISEIINRTFKIRYEIFQRRFPNIRFKDYRNSEEGKQDLDDIYTIMKEVIFARFEVIDKQLNKQIIEHFLIADELDFNDKALVLHCKEHDFVLLTHDIDFKNVDIEILTLNRRILN